MMIRTLGILACICLGFILPAFSAGHEGKLEVNQNGSSLDYTIVNENPMGDSGYVTTFNLATTVSFKVIGTPIGWAFSTDNKTFIQWYATDPSNGADGTVLAPGDVAPGAKLSGFSLESKNVASGSQTASLVFWDHMRKEPGGISAVYKVP